MKIDRPQFLRYRDLDSLGIVWTRKHLRTLVRQGRFPPPIQVGANTLVWKRSDVEDFLAGRPTGVLAATAAERSGTASLLAERDAMRRKAAVRNGAG